MGKREQLLLELLNSRQPIHVIRAELSKFQWDSETELVTLTRAHLKKVLSDFVAGHLTVSDVETWAETVEGRDDIGIDAEHSELLKSIVFELATQELGLPLSPSLAERYMEELSR
jgi:hypothetical protein